MRAAIRKLRTLLVLFAPYLDRAAAQRFNAVLRDLGRVLGAGRDWDVFLTETLPKAEASMEPAGLALLRAPAEALSAEAHARVGDAVESPQLTGLILGLGAWTADAGWLREAEPDALLRDLLPQLLTRLEKRVRKRARHLDGHAAHDLHDLRKALKKLRYGVEDVEPLFKHKRVSHYLKSIKDILAVLGDINDAAVTVERASEVAPPERPELAPRGCRPPAVERRSPRARRSASSTASCTSSSVRRRSGCEAQGDRLNLMDAALGLIAACGNVRSACNGCRLGRRVPSASNDLGGKGRIGLLRGKDNLLKRMLCFSRRTRDRRAQAVAVSLGDLCDA